MKVITMNNGAIYNADAIVSISPIQKPKSIDNDGKYKLQIFFQEGKEIRIESLQEDELIIKKEKVLQFCISTTSKVLEL